VESSSHKRPPTLTTLTHVHVHVSRVIRWLSACEDTFLEDLAVRVTRIAYAPHEAIATSDTLNVMLSATRAHTRPPWLLVPTASCPLPPAHCPLPPAQCGPLPTDCVALWAVQVGHGLSRRRHPQSSQPGLTDSAPALSTAPVHSSHCAVCTHYV
jgi:hypothetical protein